MSHRMIFPCRLCWKLSPSLSIKISEGAPLCNKLCLLRAEWRAESVSIAGHVQYVHDVPAEMWCSMRWVYKMPIF